MEMISKNNVADKLKVFAHQIYECKKGVRNMALCTLTDDCMEYATNKLNAMQISYFINVINTHKFNIFFGASTCISVVEKFCNKPLNRLSPEEDFMLGTMLGYSICEQCQRYNKMKQRCKNE